MAELTYYRALRPGWSFAPLSGKGAALAGGRWNAKGLPALYLAADPMTAVAEYNQDVLFRPVTLAQYRISGARLADIRDADFRADADVEGDALTIPWYAEVCKGNTPISWTIADELMNAGYHGFIYPSRISGGVCLVLWRWNDGSGCKVQVQDLDGWLPRDGSSWKV